MSNLPNFASDVLNSLPAAVLVVDMADKFSFANPAAETLLQTSATQLQHLTLEDVFGRDSAIAGLIHQSRAEMTPMAEFDVQIATPRTQPDRISISTTPAFGSYSDAASADIIVQFSPISIAQRIDQQLRRQGAARSAAGMVSVLAHEVRNPLAGIRGAAQIIEAVVDGDEKSLCRLIADEVDRIGNLIQRIDVFAEIGPTPSAEVNVHEAIERARRVLETSGALDGVDFTEAYDPSLPFVRGDFEGLVQVFLNLMKNAADAAREGGRAVTLKTRYRHGIRLAAERHQESGALPIEIVVQDNGPGIPDDLQRNIFDPFVTTKSDGHGLGLAVVAKIIGDHGGAVEFESEPRRTAFMVHLPMHVGTEQRK